MMSLMMMGNSREHITSGTNSKRNSEGGERGLFKLSLDIEGVVQQRRAGG